jgi:hypothetical protein
VFKRLEELCVMEWDVVRVHLSVVTDMLEEPAAFKKISSYALKMEAAGMPETVVTVPVCMASYVRRFESSFSQLRDCQISRISSSLSIGLSAVWFLKHLCSEKKGLLKLSTGGMYVLLPMLGFYLCLTRCVWGVVDL